MGLCYTHTHRGPVWWHVLQSVQVVQWYVKWHQPLERSGSRDTNYFPGGSHSFAQEITKTEKKNAFLKLLDFLYVSMAWLAFKLVMWKDCKLVSDSEFHMNTTTPFLVYLHHTIKTQHTSAWKIQPSLVLLDLTRGWQTLSLEGTIVNIFQLTGYTAYVATTQLFHYSMKTAWAVCKWMCMYIP